MSLKAFSTHISNKNSGEAMKRSLCIMLCVFAAISAAGCQQQKQASSAAATQPKTTQSTTAKYETQPKTEANTQATSAAATQEPTQPETQPETTAAPEVTTAQPETQPDVQSRELTLSINGQTVDAQWEDNEAVAALKQAAGQSPLNISMSKYGGFEQVGSLKMTLPSNDEQITTSPGDIILYSGNQIVLFYGSNTWAYTRLGKITGKTQAELTDLLSNGDVTITIS
jgi:hypothetical protein